MNKKARQEEAAADDGGDLIGRLPEAVVADILERLDVESLCSAAPVCRSLRTSVSRALSSLTALDLSGFPPTAQILNRVLNGNNVIRSLTVDCIRLDDSSINIFAKEHLHELVLLRCSMFSAYVFTAIRDKCSNLRLLSVEMLCQSMLLLPRTFKISILQLLRGCFYLESLCIKFQSQYLTPEDFDSIQLVLPKNIKVLLLQPVSDGQAKQLILNSAVDRDPNPLPLSYSADLQRTMNFTLHSLSLVLSTITDELLFVITSNLHCLAELCLEDKPLEEPWLPNDLTNSGLQTLASCADLTCISLTRNRKYLPTTFRLVNDIGILLLAEGCKKLETIRLGGFSKVTDAGYSSILHSCKNLKRFEIVNAFFFSDLTLHVLADTPCSLIDVRLMSCNYITSEALESLSLCRNLEVLDLSGCRSIANPGLYSISKLQKLTVLDLGGADITDSGLLALGEGCCPIASLCLRGCKRVTDRGIDQLLMGNGLISRTVMTLDLGYMPGLSNRGINTIANVCRNLTDLCIRNCFFVSDVSIVALGSIGGKEFERRSLRRLDLYNCCGLSLDLFNLLTRPSFCGLRWLGVGSTRMLAKGTDKLVELLTKNRPALSICVSGCEMGCMDGWQFHEGY